MTGHCPLRGMALGAQWGGRDVKEMEGVPLGGQGSFQTRTGLFAVFGAEG